MLPIRDTIPGRNPPIGTWLVILANSVVSLLELMMPQPVLEQFVHLFGIVPARFTHPDWALRVGFPLDDYWPFLTSMFLHGGWLHIIGNMWTLWTTSARGLAAAPDSRSRPPTAFEAARSRRVFEQKRDEDDHAGTREEDETPCPWRSRAIASFEDHRTGQRR